MRRLLSGFTQFAGCALVAAMLLSGPARAEHHADVIDATVQFDHQYIPTLYFIRTSDATSAAQALDKLKGQWQVFRQQFDHLDSDPQWHHFIGIASGMLSDAEQALSEGNLPAASEHLEGIAVTLRGLRERNGVTGYFLDELYDYRYHMQAIINAVKGKTAQSMTLADVRTVQKHWAEVWPRWDRIRRKVSRGEFDQHRYRFSDDRFIELKQAIGQEQQALFDLKFALLNGSRDRIAQAGVALSPGFERAWRAFGDLDYNAIYDQQ